MGRKLRLSIKEDIVCCGSNVARSYLTSYTYVMIVKFLKKDTSHIYIYISINNYWLSHYICLKYRRNHFNSFKKTFY